MLRRTVDTSFRTGSVRKAGGARRTAGSTGPCRDPAGVGRRGETAGIPRNTVPRRKNGAIFVPTAKNLIFRQAGRRAELAQATPRRENEEENLEDDDPYYRFYRYIWRENQMEAPHGRTESLRPDRRGRGRQRRVARRDAVSDARRSSLRRRARLRPRRNAGRRGRQRLRHLAAADVPRIDPLPLDASRVTPQGGVPHPRPHLHLRRHRRNLHPDRTVGHRGLAGYLHYGTAMGDGALRHHLQVARPPFDSGRSA